MEVALEFISEGFATRTVLTHCKLSKSSFYYKSSEGVAGRKPYATIHNSKGEIIAESEIVERIKLLFSRPFVDYGAYKTFRHLTDKEKYKISKHYVYKLMKNNNLLRGVNSFSSKKSKRNMVKDLIPKVETEFSFFEFDIKYVWVSGQRRSMQVLTILDVYSRTNIGHYMAYNIKKEDVIRLFEKVIVEFGLPKNFIVRNDNGSQFIAKIVQDFLKDNGITQEFTKPGTPQQNAHIESYHSIMERAVCQRFEFENIKIAKKTMEEFRDFYNFERIHGGIGFMSPYEYLLQKGADLKSTPFMKSDIGGNTNLVNYKKVS
jgi:transposase InsO family protein